MPSRTFASGSNSDLQEIAALHALSWQRHYRNILPDHYLDHEVEVERLNLWRDRLQKADETLKLITLREDNKLIGFSGIFLDKHETYGAYIDNLHVLEEYQGEGLGKELMLRTAKLVFDHDPRSAMYLYVFDENTLAIRFYEKIGGHHISSAPMQSPGGVCPLVRLYLWEDVKTFLGR